MIWTMISKKITFDYKGGEYTQSFKIRGTNLPWTYECDVDWISVNPGASSLTIDVYYGGVDDEYYVAVMHEAVTDYNNFIE